MKTKGRSRLQLCDLLKVLSIPVLLAVWHLMSLWLRSYRLPNEITVLKGLFTTLFSSEKLNMAGAGDHGFWPHVAATFLKVTAGYTLGSLLGVLAGMLMKMHKRLRYFLHLPIDVLRTVPPIAFVPILFMLLGRSVAVQLAVIVLYSFLTIVVNTMNAIGNVPPIYQRYALTLGASRTRVQRDVILPCILPELLGAFRVGIIWAWGYQVIIEMMGSEHGLGKVFYHTKLMNALDLVLIGVVWVIILAGVTDLLLGLFWGRATRWQEKVKSEAVKR